MYKEISACRICGNKNLVSLIHLGKQTLTGVFPKTKSEKITSGPLELAKCHANESNNVCGLVQLNHSYSIKEMYGENYGYKSGLNKSMVKHLQQIVKDIKNDFVLQNGDLIIDIGSNDSTLLSTYPASNGYTLVGIDPITKFRKYYPNYIQLIPDFFSSKIVKSHFQNKKAKIITSIAVFYDLENPMEFVKQVYDVLDDKGIWIFEQSYLPSMLKTNSYDTICHEHLEYYGLKQIKWMLDNVGFKIIDVDINTVNGGSFRVTAAKEISAFQINQQKIDELLEYESNIHLNDIEPYQKFAENIKTHKEKLCKLLREINNSGKTIFGYGASTKGNVILQYCGITDKDIPYIAEVNEEKFGAYTPFTHIPIISEKKAKAMKPDYFLVLPWHFKEGILKKEENFLESGGKFILPLPEIHIVSR